MGIASEIYAISRRIGLASPAGGSRSRELRFAAAHAPDESHAEAVQTSIIGQARAGIDHASAALAKLDIVSMRCRATIAQEASFTLELGRTDRHPG